MKKDLKITLIVLGVLVGVVALDTLQAKIFDNSPIIRIRKNLDGGSIDYIDKGIFVNHYHCNNNENVTTWKGAKFACSVAEFNFYISKNDNKDSSKFNEYLTFDNRKIYLTKNIAEFYVVDEETMNLKKFIFNASNTLNNSIKKITDKLELTGALYDGGTKIYKSKEKDITLINCQKMDGNHNIYIGDYLLEFTDSICD